MIQNLLYQNQQLKEFLDKSKFDILVVEKIIWQIDEKEQCVPYVTGKLKVGFPKVEFGFRPNLPANYNNLDFRQLLNLYRCN